MAQQAADSASFPMPYAPLKSGFRLGTLVGIKFSLVDSFWGPIWRVMDTGVRYQAGGAASLPIFFLEGTVFGQPRNTLSLLIFVSISYITCFLVGVPKFPSNGQADPEYLSYQEAKMHLQVFTNLFTGGLDNTKLLVGFLLSGFVVSLIGKWQSQRELYARAIGNTRDALMKLSCFLHTDLQDPQDMAAYAVKPFAVEAQSTSSRYFNLAIELALLKVSGFMDDEQKAKPFLEARGLLKPGEWERLIPGDRHSTVYYWILCWLRQCKSLGIMSEYEFGMMAESINKCRASANDFNDTLATAYPFAFQSFVNLVLKCFLLFLSIHSGLKMASSRILWIEGIQTNMLASTVHVEPPWYWWTCWALMQLGCYVTFHGLLDLQYILSDPFAGNVHGVPHEPIVYGQLAKYTEWLMTGNCKPEISKACSGI